MNTFENGLFELVPEDPQVWPARVTGPSDRAARSGPAAHTGTRDPEFLRRCAWEVGERRRAEAYTPTASHVGLGMVTPYEGFAHYHILPGWVEETARRKGDAWHH